MILFVDFSDLTDDNAVRSDLVIRNVVEIMSLGIQNDQFLRIGPVNRGGTTVIPQNEICHYQPLLELEFEILTKIECTYFKIKI